MAAEKPEVSSGDRLSFTVFLAGILHATLILGVGFTVADTPAPPHTLEVTLAQHNSEDMPDKADFLAQNNQMGSGTLEEKALISTTEKADFHSDKVKHVQLREKTSRQTVEKNAHRSVISTSGLSKQKISLQQRKKSEHKLKKSNSVSLLERSQEIASLQARLDKQKQAYAKRPRIRQLTSVSTRAHRDAMYVDSFRKEIEEVGTRNFPKRALRDNIFGSVRLLVAIKNDGTVKNIEVRKSSGHPFLDSAAIQSVKLASPFSPFPENIRQDTDILEIIRTWKFDKRQQLSSSN